MQVVVIKNYRLAYPDPLILKTGDQLTIIPKESEWPGWLWCKSENNKQGWVPENYMDISGNFGIILRDYSAAELTVKTGDTLLVLEEESGWYYCRDVNNNFGWIPGDNARFC